MTETEHRLEHAWSQWATLLPDELPPDVYQQARLLFYAGCYAVMDLLSEEHTAKAAQRLFSDICDELDEFIARYYLERGHGDQLPSELRERFEHKAVQ